VIIYKWKNGFGFYRINNVNRSPCNNVFSINVEKTFSLLRMWIVEFVEGGRENVVYLDEERAARIQSSLI